MLFMDTTRPRLRAFEMESGYLHATTVMLPAGLKETNNVKIGPADIS